MRPAFRLEPSPVPGARWLPVGPRRWALVDANDFDRAAGIRWSPGSKGYAMNRAGGGCIYLHRFILDAELGVDVDHRNGDPLDCRRTNLRTGTTAQNMQNQRMVSTERKRVPFKGVTLRRGPRPYQARIRDRGEQASLGRFETAEDAARAYDDEARRRWGARACVNFPRADERAAR